MVKKPVTEIKNPSSVGEPLLVIFRKGYGRRKLSPHTWWAFCCVNMNERNTIKIRVPHTKFFVIGEQIEKDVWNMYVFDPDTKAKEIIKKGIATKTFALMSNVTLKTPLPYVPYEE